MFNLVKQRPYAFSLLAVMTIIMIYLISSGFLVKLVVGTLEFVLLLAVIAYAAYAAFFRKLPLM
jgi:uncharacterized membrane protein